MRSAAVAGAAATAVITALVLTACAAEPGVDPDADVLTGTVVTDGSSTVGPLTKAAALSFGGVHPDVQVTVQITGTGGGFRSFCNGQTDISNASRPISDDEAEACAEAGVEFTEIVIANDGISVVVNPENDWIDCLARPLFIYVDNASYADEDAVKAFVDYYVDNADTIARSSLFVPLTDEQTDLAQDELASLG